MANRVLVSIVSHGQGALVDALLNDLEVHCFERIHVVLTLNIPEILPFKLHGFRFPIECIRNSQPKGFGANHNHACRRRANTYYCILNPDVRLNGDPFGPLLVCIEKTNAALVGPVVIDPLGRVDDSARPFPTPVGILSKALRTRMQIDHPIHAEPTSPDWIAGMFMLFQGLAFNAVGGFDERYFLYYEDVDICARLRLMGYRIALCPWARVIHAARRDSHRKFRHMVWHVKSMCRFFASPVFRAISQRSSIMNPKRR